MHHNTATTLQAVHYNKMNSSTAPHLAVDTNNNNANSVVGRMRVQQEVDQLPLAEKEAYMEALRKASRRVLEFEVDPLKFLRVCDFNAKAAAKRLCFYWKERKSLFGEERAFRPMDLSEQGALTREDILSLRAGWPAILPDTRTGQKVLLADRRQFHPSASPESRLRCAFYVEHVVSEAERSQTEGVLVLVMGALPRTAPPDQTHYHRSNRLVREAFPNKPLYHILNLPTAPCRRYEVQAQIASNIDNHVALGSKLNDLEVHFEREPGELYQTLVGLGLTHDGIPSYLGGAWTFVSHTNFCRAQAQADRALQHQQRQRRLGTARVRREATTLPECLAATARRDLLADKAEQRQRTRERNLIHSRRKRERRRQELVDLQDEHQQLHGEQEYLLAEKERLESLLVKAQASIAHCSNESTCPPRKKKPKMAGSSSS